MNVIITAGGTSEYIDSVRKITNSSSGKLGSIIANKFLQSSKINKVFYVCHKGAILPTENKKIEIIYIKTVENLQKTLETLIKIQKIDVIVHSMAVSDYTVEYVTTTENLAKNLSSKTEEQITEILQNKNLGVDNSKKISSSLSEVFIKLVPTPKVISKIKEWDKNIFLVGFKLLSNVSKENLLEVATAMLKKNDCDAVVANDLKDISAEKHKAYILKKDGNIVDAQTKDEIAERLSEIVEKIKE